MLFRLVLFAVLMAPVPAQTLRDLAGARGVHAGTCAAAGFLREPEYSTVLAREYNQLEPENEMKFGPIQPGPDTFAFGPADALVEFARLHAMRVRGHTLVWHNQNPVWLTKGSYGPAELSAMMKKHIATVVGHYAGKVFGWDVVNEAFNEDGTLRSTLWLDKPGIGLKGTGYIEQALRWAHAADAKATLFYNDYNNETINAKSDAILAMAKDFKQRGVPLDGVGLQMHITLNTDLSTFDENLKRFADLGLIIEITELDIRVPVDANGAATQADLELQAAMYGKIAATCLKYPACQAIQTWGFTDKHSWVPRFFKGTGAALPFDASYEPKPAYTALVKAFAKP